MRFHDRAVNIKWGKGIKRPDKSNAIDILCSGQTPKSDIEKRDYEKKFEVVPTPFSESEREQWMKDLSEVAVSSDAFCEFCHSPQALRHSTDISMERMLFAHSLWLLFCLMGLVLIL